MQYIMARDSYFNTNFWNARGEKSYVRDDWLFHKWECLKRHSTEAATRGGLRKKVFWEVSQYSQENTCARASFFNKVAGPRPATLLKNRLWHRCYPVSFVKFLRTTLLQNTSAQLLLIQVTFKRKMSLSHFSPVFHFIKKPVIWFALKIKWLVFIWNATLGWNRLKWAEIFIGHAKLSDYFHLTLEFKNFVER